MNSPDILHYGHEHVLVALKDMTTDEWTTVGVTSRWSIKDMLAHLVSYHAVLAEVLAATTGETTPTPHLTAISQSFQGFNDAMVAQRTGLTPAELLAEYETHHQRIMTNVQKIPVAELQKVGTVPWYGPQYCLEDFIVYASYGHAEEHIGQIKTFRRWLQNKTF